MGLLAPKKLQLNNLESEDESPQSQIKKLKDPAEALGKTSVNMKTPHFK